MQEIVIREEKIENRVLEAFKTLRTNLEFCSDNMQVLFITSTTPNEGKSTVAFHLAQSFADNDYRVLVIDADIRKSVLKEKVRGKGPRLGLSHLLVGKATYDEVICATNFKNLDVIFAGPSSKNPAELLGSARFANLVETARREYDIILVDTAPIGSVIDSVIVSKCCDAGILVVAACESSYKFVRKAKEQLDVANCKILGCVLNKVDVSKNSYYGKYYGKYYVRYYGKYYDA